MPMSVGVLVIGPLIYSLMFNYNTDLIDLNPGINNRVQQLQQQIKLLPQVTPATTPVEPKIPSEQKDKASPV